MLNLDEKEIKFSSLLIMYSIEVNLDQKYEPSNLLIFYQIVHKWNQILVEKHSYLNVFLILFCFTQVINMIAKLFAY